MWSTNHVQRAEIGFKLRKKTIKMGIEPAVQNPSKMKNHRKYQQ